MAVSNLNYTVRWFCVKMSPVVFYSMSTVCQEFILYCLLFLCHYVPSFLLQYVHCNSVSHTVPSVGPLSLFPQLSSTVLHCLSVRHTLPHLALCLSVQCCGQMSFHYLSVPYTVQCVDCLSVPHTVPSFGSVSLCLILPSTFCPMSASTSHGKVFPCHYLHCCLL
jgi:hypothetical protein